MTSTCAEIPVTPIWDASLRGRPVSRSGVPRRRTALTGAVSWTSVDARARVWLQVRSGVAVLSLQGHLGQEGFAVFRSGVDAVIGLRLSHVVVDVSKAELSHASIALLGLMRRYAGRHGVDLWLACVPHEVRNLMERLHVAALYRIQPTVPIAVAVAANLRPTARRAHRRA